MGGFFFVHGDGNSDGVGGDITLTSNCSVDVSGGSGDIGGSARTAAIILDADGDDSDGANNGIVINNGSLVARGGSADGNGGGVRFDGLNEGLTVGPAAGSQDRSANGAGTDGTFTGQ